jgi:hypothetical protein
MISKDVKLQNESSANGGQEEAAHATLTGIADPFSEQTDQRHDRGINRSNRMPKGFGTATSTAFAICSSVANSN